MHSMNTWLIVGTVAASHFFVYFLGKHHGKKEAVEEMTYRQMQMDATRMWAEAFTKKTGGDI